MPWSFTVEIDSFQGHSQNFRVNFITENEIWIHDYSQRSKNSSNSGLLGEFTQPGKLLWLFQKFQGIIFIDSLEKGKTIVGVHYASLLDSLKTELRSNIHDYPTTTTHQFIPLQIDEVVIVTFSIFPLLSRFSTLGRIPIAIMADEKEILIQIRRLLRKRIPILCALNNPMIRKCWALNKVYVCFVFITEYHSSLFVTQYSATNE